MKRQTALMLIIALAACGDDRPPAPTAEQAARLDETEAMLNNVAETQEGPETPVPGPSNRSD